jgi:CHASE3 domain sensor protein
LIKDNPIQIIKLDSLKRLIDLKIASSLEIITVREQAVNAAIEIISTQRSKQMDDIRKVSYNMDQLEENSLIARNKIAVDSYFCFNLCCFRWYYLIY